MTTIGAYEAKTRFSELLERAEKGESFIITRHGKVVAELRPVRRHDAERVKRGFEIIDKISRRVDLNDLTWEDLKAMRDEGKR